MKKVTSALIPGVVGLGYELGLGKSEISDSGVNTRCCWARVRARVREKVKSVTSALIPVFLLARVGTRIREKVKSVTPALILGVVRLGSQIFT